MSKHKMWLKKWKNNEIWGYIPLPPLSDLYKKKPVGGIAAKNVVHTFLDATGGLRTKRRIKWY